MKLFSTLNLLLITGINFGQQAFHNYGTIEIHDKGKIAFHTDVINDGDFDDNRGQSIFYSDNILTVSGQNPMKFYDVDVDVKEDLILETRMGITNFHEFVNGHINTPKFDPNVSLDYENDAPYLGADDNKHVDGYVTQTGILDFTFPIGSNSRLMPLSIESSTTSNTFRAAYFFEDPNLATTFTKTFDTNRLNQPLSTVSKFEFWDLDGENKTKITLHWDDVSKISKLVTDPKYLRVVGWDDNLQTWIDLGNTKFTGDLSKGTVTSNSVIPDNYTVLTFGSIEESSIINDDLEVYTAVSPNNDGQNDTFIIENLDKYPNNELLIFNRWGVEVYNHKKYHEVQFTNKGFNGISQGRVTTEKTKRLPAGTYFYILKVNGTKNLSGYLYLNR